jgi:membrane protease YdiL (CAAX protease family)
MRADLSTWSFLAWVLLLMPVMGVLSYYRVKSGKPLSPKRRRFVVTMVVELLLLGLALNATPPGLVLFPKVFPDGTALLYGAVVLGAFLVGLSRGVKRIPAERREKARLRMPENPKEFRLWAVIPLLAGVCEETAYRGVLYRLLLNAWHSVALAILVAVIAFAAAHAIQGWRGALAVGILGGIFHAIVLITGTLYVAILVHVVYDFVLGYLLMRSLHSEPTAAPA